MAHYKARYVIQVTDVNGDTAIVSFPAFPLDTVTLAAAATVMATLEADVAALTNGKVTRQGLQVLFSEAQYLVGSSPPTNAEYSSVTDGAHLAFADGLGERMSVTIPAPLEAVFGASSNVVNPTYGAIATLISDVAASCGSPSGGQYNLYKGGIKVGRHSRRRVSRLIP